MPIYAYRCDDCGQELEALQKVSDAPLTECPACGAPALKKQITAAAFRLKGSGWYETDFKKDGKKNLHGDSDKPKDTAAPAGDKAADKAGDKSSDKGSKSEPTPTKSDKAATPKKAAATGT